MNRSHQLYILKNKILLVKKKKKKKNLTLTSNVPKNIKTFNIVCNLKTILVVSDYSNAFNLF